MSDNNNVDAKNVILEGLEKVVEKKIYKRKHGDYKAEFEGKALGWEPV